MHEKMTATPENPDAATFKYAILESPTPVDLEGPQKVLDSLDTTERSLLNWLNGNASGDSTTDHIDRLLEACPTPFELEPLKDVLLTGVKNGIMRPPTKPVNRPSILCNKKSTVSVLTFIRNFKNLPPRINGVP